MTDVPWASIAGLRNIVVHGGVILVDTAGATDFKRNLVEARGAIPVEEIAPRASFEEMTWLLWNGGLPTAGEHPSSSTPRPAAGPSPPRGRSGGRHQRYT